MRIILCANRPLCESSTGIVRIMCQKTTIARIILCANHPLRESSCIGNDSFIGTKVLGTFAPEEPKFHRSESSKERMFHGTKVPRERKFSPGTFRSRERKCRGTKRPGFNVLGANRPVTKFATLPAILR